MRVFFFASAGADVLIATRTDAAAPTPPSIDESRARNAVAPVGVYPPCGRRARFSHFEDPVSIGPRPSPDDAFARPVRRFFTAAERGPGTADPYAVSSRRCPTAEKHGKMTSVKVLAALFLYACTVRECAQHDNEPVKTVL